MLETHAFLYNKTTLPEGTGTGNQLHKDLEFLFRQVAGQANERGVCVDGQDCN